MRITILYIDGKAADFINLAVRKYQMQMPKGYPVEWLSVAKHKKGSRTSPDEVMRQEGRALLSKIPANTYVIALDRLGSVVNTQQIVASFNKNDQKGVNISFLIGGAEGLDHSCIAHANTVWSLSALTFAHGVVRVLLAEQLYRVASYIQGHPYHRD